MEIFIAQLISGLALGSIYVLLVTGFNLMLLVAKIIQFAYPQIVVISMYTCWGVLQLTDNKFLVILAGISISIILSILSEPIFRKITSTQGVDINVSFIASMGMAMIIMDILSHSINYGFPVAFPSEWIGGNLLRFGLITVSKGQLYALIGGIIAVLLFSFLLYRTNQGRFFRAIAENRFAACLVGIPIVKTSIFSYFIVGVLGGFSAILFSMLIGSASPWLGEFVALKMLAVSIVAGLGNLRGGLVCGLLLGIIEAMVVGYISGSWSNVIAFVVMLVVILIKPQGLFGSKI
jgi:branched-chain amino acid transport system permease protein